MKKQIFKTFLFSVIFFVVPNFASAAPSISSATGTISDGQNVTIEGYGFGTKSTSAPFYYSNYDSETTGAAAQNLVTNLSSRGLVQANRAHSGNKSLEADFCTDLGRINWSIGNDYIIGNYIQYPANTGSYYRVLNHVASSGANGTPDVDTTNYILETGGLPAPHCSTNRTSHYLRDAVDFNSIGGASEIYMSMWLFMDFTTTTAGKFQWKNFSPTACINMYACAEATHPFMLSENFTVAPYAGAWWNGAPLGYVGGMIGGASYNPGAPSDMWLIGQWQRVEFWVKRNSVDNASDGIVWFNRVGRPTPLNYSTTVRTHATGDTSYRYMVLNNGIDSVYSGYVDMKTYMDDVYVDISPARIEMCDTPTWAARTHCEIQKPTAWSDTGATVNLNQGTFANSSNVYLYAVDGNGNMNANGYVVTLGSNSSDTTAPSAPSGLSVL